MSRFIHGGPNTGGRIFSRYYIPDTETQAYFLFSFHLLINQIYVPHHTGKFVFVTPNICASIFYANNCVPVFVRDAVLRILLSCVLAPTIRHTNLQVKMQFPLPLQQCCKYDYKRLCDCMSSILSMGEGARTPRG